MRSRCEASIKEHRNPSINTRYWPSAEEPRGGDPRVQKEEAPSRLQHGARLINRVPGKKIRLVQIVRDSP